MFTALFQMFRKLNGSNSPRRRPAANRKASLHVEALEQRDMPAVVFNPGFGPESIAAGSSFANMQHPAVNIVFSGSYWVTRQGLADETALFASARSILTGPYLSGLTQYGSDGIANLNLTWPDTATLPINPSATDLQTYLQKSITSHSAAPGINDWQHAPVFIVVSDPASSHGSNGGFNAGGTYKQSLLGLGSITENMRMIWLSTNTNSATDSHVRKDNFTDLFSHEMAETMANGIVIARPPSLPATVTGDSQISDLEPDGGRYGYRLNGDYVQAYWSQRDQGYLVPDGNAQVVRLYPRWTQGAFDWQFDVYVNGDQKGANFADNVVVANSGGAAVTLNLEKFVFEPTMTHTLTVNTVGGSNKIEVDSLPGDLATLNLQNYSGTNAIVLGTGSLTGFGSGTTINVLPQLGTTNQSTVFINGSSDGAQFATVTSQTVTYEGLRLNYSSMLLNGTTRGVTTLTLDTGWGSHIDVESVAAYTNLWVDWYLGIDVHGPAAGKVHFLVLATT